MRREGSAPGKLIIMGEYAVRHGAPCVVTAVDRRVRARLEPAAVFSVAAAGEAPSAFDVVEGRARFRADVTLVARARLELAAQLIAAAGVPPVAATIDSAPLQSEIGEKLGLGSSGAVCVALAAAIAGSTRQLDPRRLFEQADRAHRAVHARTGSGVDIAASAWGGTLVFEKRRDGAPEVEPLALPAELGVAVLWTKRSADTARLLEAVDALPEAKHSAHHQRLGSLAQDGVRTLRAGDVPGFLEVAGAFAAALAELGADSGADIVSAPHRELGALVARAGGVYKPSGAGGGDVGIAFVAGGAEAALALRRTLSRAHVSALPLTLAAAGPAVVDL